MEVKEGTNAVELYLDNSVQSILSRAGFVCFTCSIFIGLVGFIGSSGLGLFKDLSNFRFQFNTICFLIFVISSILWGYNIVKAYQRYKTMEKLFMVEKM